VLHLFGKMLRGHDPDRDRFVVEPGGQITIRGSVEALTRLVPAAHLCQERSEPRVHLMVVWLVLENLRITGDGLLHPAPATGLVGDIERRAAIVGLPRGHRGYRMAAHGLVPSWQLLPEVAQRVATDPSPSLPLLNAAHRRKCGLQWSIADILEGSKQAV